MDLCSQCHFGEDLSAATPGTNPAAGTTHTAAHRTLPAECHLAATPPPPRAHVSQSLPPPYSPDAESGKDHVTGETMTKRQVGQDRNPTAKFSISMEK